MIVEILLTMKAYQLTPTNIITMAYICSIGVRALMSPYPTVVNVLNAQYIEEVYAEL